MIDPALGFGTQLDSRELALPRAASIAAHVRAERSQFATYVDAFHSDDGRETVIVDVEVEVPQVRVHPIAAVERVAIQCRPEDRLPPEVLALRQEFPTVPHRNLRSTEYPQSLCLYDQPWNELRIRWTPAAFLERIRTWLAMTARGELHAVDQPLEPILLAWEHHIVLPADLFGSDSPSQPNRLYVELIDGTPGVLIARRVGHPRAAAGGGKFVAVTMRCEPQEHGVIRRTPTNLDDLHELASGAGLDLRAELRKVLVEWRQYADMHQARPILIIWFPKTRCPGAPTESNDVWAFALHETVAKLAPLLQAWEVNGKHVALILGEPTIPAGTGKHVGVSLLNPSWTLTGPVAAALNGVTANSECMVAIGAGALGSQVIMNLVRSGVGKWTIIDHDRMFPHNLARHELDGYSVGLPKAEAMAMQAQSIRDTEAAPTAIVADILDPGDKRQVIEEAIGAASCVLDLSASVPVARAISRSGPIVPRRVSTFLSPSGSDFVLLAEDTRRASKLDHLEHQLYRDLVTNPELAGHFDREVSRIRYAHSCRDVSSRLPQHLASLHASIASHALLQTLAQPDAAIRVWRAAEDLTVRCITVKAETTIEHVVGEWTLCTDSRFYNRIAELRRAKLPNETGGVLLGSFDLERKIIYLVDTIPSPPDSKEWPTLYIRGSEGLYAEVQRVSAITAGMLQYVGEWHSHPSGVPPLPSSDDCKVFAWLTELMDRDGFPALMLIAADSESVVFVGRMVQGARP